MAVARTPVPAHQAHHGEDDAGNTVHDFLRRGVIGPISRTGGGEHPEAALGAVLKSLFVRQLSVEIGFGGRSEEHTSELQSLMRISYAVFCLKKQTKIKLKSMKPK